MNTSLIKIRKHGRITGKSFLKNEIFFNAFSSLCYFNWKRNDTLYLLQAVTILWTSSFDLQLHRTIFHSKKKIIIKLYDTFQLTSDAYLNNWRVDNVHKRSHVQTYWNARHIRLKTSFLSYVWKHFQDKETLIYYAIVLSCLRKCNARVNKGQSISRSADYSNPLVKRANLDNIIQEEMVLGPDGHSGWQNVWLQASIWCSNNPISIENK